MTAALPLHLSYSWVPAFFEFRHVELQPQACPAGEQRIIWAHGLAMEKILGQSSKLMQAVMFLSKQRLRLRI